MGPGKRPKFIKNRVREGSPIMNREGFLIPIEMTPERISYPHINGSGKGYLISREMGPGRVPYNDPGRIPHSIEMTRERFSHPHRNGSGKGSLIPREMGPGRVAYNEPGRIPHSHRNDS